VTKKDAYADNWIIHPTPQTFHHPWFLHMREPEHQHNGLNPVEYNSSFKIKYLP